MKKLWMLPALAVALAACSQPVTTSPAPTPLNVSGRYLGTLQIPGNPPSGTATLILSQQGASAISAAFYFSGPSDIVTGEGDVNTGRIVFADNTGNLTFQGVFTNTTYKGNFTLTTGGTSGSGVFNFTKQ